MKWEQANRERRCLCCSEPDAMLLRLTDGRAGRACPTCLQRCALCMEQINGAQERDPVRSEQDWVAP